MVAYPAIIAKMDFWEALGPDQIRAVLRQAIQQLPGGQQDIVLSLDHSTGGALVQDILNTNIFGIELDGVMHMGLYPESSVSLKRCVCPRCVQELTTLRDSTTTADLSTQRIADGKEWIESLLTSY